jgi:hypothetical protein
VAFVVVDGNGDVDDVDVVLDDGDHDVDDAVDDVVDDDVDDGDGFHGNGDDFVVDGGGDGDDATRDLMYVILRIALEFEKHVKTCRLFRQRQCFSKSAHIYIYKCTKQENASHMMKQHATSQRMDYAHHREDTYLYDSYDNSYISLRFRHLVYIHIHVTCSYSYTWGLF